MKTQKKRSSVKTRFRPGTTGACEAQLWTFAGPPGILKGDHGRLCYAAARVAKARTGNVPIPFTFTGVAVKLKPSAGNCSRSHICSTIGIPAPSKIVCTGRVPSAVSSMLYESMPTSAAPAFRRYSAASRVRYR